MFATEVNTIITKYHNYRWNKVTICMHSLHREQKTDSSWQDWARPSKFPHVSSLIFLKDLAWNLVSQSYTNKNCHANWILAQLFMKFISNFNSVLKNGSLKKKTDLCRSAEKDNSMRLQPFKTWHIDKLSIIKVYRQRDSNCLPYPILLCL